MQVGACWWSVHLSTRHRETKTNRFMFDERGGTLYTTTLEPYNYSIGGFMRFVRFHGVAGLVTVILLTGPAPTEARGLPETNQQRFEALRSSLVAPAYCAATHDVGNIALGVTNTGVTGSAFYPSSPTDCFSGTQVPGCRYPKGSDIEYLFGGALWIGAVVNGDTLVSVGADGWQNCREMSPNQAIPNHMIYRSLHGPDAANAVSEEDFVSVYTDTFTSGVTGLCDDEIAKRPHRPLPVEVTEKSYAWSTDEVSKVVFVELAIRNIGANTLGNAYVGLYVDADIGSAMKQPWNDDLSGLLRIARDSSSCGADQNQLLVPYVIDNDGDLDSGSPAPSAIGLTFIRVPIDSARFSYHWWQSSTDSTQDYGPQRKNLIRNFGTGGTGTPEGDRNKYFLMRSGEQDFDQIYTASIGPADPAWVYPNQSIAARVSSGNDARLLFSVGPFTVAPDQTVSLVYAWVIGDSVHRDPNNLQNLPNDPEAYYANLDFSGLARTVRAAHRFYDNPGVDTDDDGYLGQFVTCCIESVLVEPPLTYECSLADTVWTGGDGVPDYLPYTPKCCIGRTGNVNLMGITDLSDLSALVNYLTGEGYTLPCPISANVDGSGIVDLSDLSALVGYLKGSEPVLQVCP